MKLKTQSEIVNCLLDEYKSYFVVNEIIILDKPIVYRKSPHDNSLIIYELNYNDNYNNDRQLISTILQRLRRTYHATTNKQSSIRGNKAT